MSSATDASARIAQLEQQMRDAAERLDFETAIELRRELMQLKNGKPQ